MEYVLWLRSADLISVPEITTTIRCILQATFSCGTMTVPRHVHNVFPGRHRTCSPGDTERRWNVMNVELETPQVAVKI